MFYTKYRPQTFSEISRPNEAADALATQVSTGKTAHAYLFVGPRGTGKTSTARILAKALNCSNLSKNGDPCDKCEMCLAVKTGSLPDLIEIDAASNRGIDDIRSLQDQINLAPSYGKHKIYIIDEVHMLTPQAFNALLKTLEEPPHNVTFILCTTEAHKVPDTIKSRCQVFRFKRATVPQLVTKLRFIAESEGHTVEEDFLSRVASSSLGGFRDAETLLQQMLEGGMDLTSSAFSLADKTVLVDFISLLKDRESSLALKLVNDLYEKGLDLIVWTHDIVIYLRDVLLIKSGFSREAFDMSDHVMKEFINHSNELDIPWLIHSLNKFMEAADHTKKSFIPQLPLEIAIVEICNFENTQDVSRKPTNNPVTPSNTTTPRTSGKLNEHSESDSKKIDHTKEPQEKEKTSSRVSAVASSKHKPSISVEDVTQQNDTFADISIDLPTIEVRWEEFLNKMKDVNSALLAMLKSTRISGTKGKFLILEVYFAFHKERLEHSKNREVLEKVLFDVFNIPLSVTCVLASEKPKKLKDREVGVLTDVNVVPVDTAELMNVFDGGLPL